MTDREVMDVQDGTSDSADGKALFLKEQATQLLPALPEPKQPAFPFQFEVEGILLTYWAVGLMMPGKGAWILACEQMPG